jgi:glucoamylase
VNSTPSARGLQLVVTDGKTFTDASYLMPEQVWDGRPPTGRGGRQLGSATRSAMPLLWTHAQYIRLAWDIDAQRLIEQPSVVADRYLSR